MANLTLAGDLSKYSDTISNFFIANYTQDEIRVMTTMMAGMERLGYPYYEDNILYYFDIEDTYDRIELIDTIRNKIRSDTIGWFYDMFGIVLDTDIPNLMLVDMVESIFTILTTDDLPNLIDYLTTDDSNSYDKTVRLLADHSDLYGETDIAMYMVSVIGNFPNAILEYVLDNYTDILSDITDFHDKVPVDRILSSIDKEESIVLSCKIPYKQLPSLTILKMLKLYGIDIQSIQDIDTIAAELFIVYAISTDTDIKTIFEWVDQFDLPYQKRQVIQSKIMTYYNRYTNDPKNQTTT